MIEGHADLIDLGIEADRLAVLSRGEDSPVCLTASEECRQQNRRGHTAITAK